MYVEMLDQWLVDSADGRVHRIRWVGGVWTRLNGSGWLWLLVVSRERSGETEYAALECSPAA